MKWTVVHISAECERDTTWRSAYCDCGLLGEDGKPVEHGEPLWPERYPCVELAEFKKDLTLWESSYQGRPTVGGGFTFTILGKDEKPVKILPSYYEKVDHKGMNVYLLVDPNMGTERLRSKISKSDACAMAVIGLHDDQNYYFLDGVRERCTTKERMDHLFRLHRKWRPVKTAYEEYGLQADTVDLTQQMEKENYRFPVIVLGRAGVWHNLSKTDRIRPLATQARNGRWYFPNPATPNREPHLAELVKYIIEKEWEKHPACRFDDMLDVISRINDPDVDARFPAPQQRFAPPSFVRKDASWMSL